MADRACHAADAVATARTSTEESGKAPERDKIFIAAGAIVSKGAWGVYEHMVDQPFRVDNSAGWHPCYCFPHCLSVVVFPYVFLPSRHHHE